MRSERNTALTLGERMRSKNSKSHTRGESAHMAAVKESPCSVCDAPAPCEAHHISQGQHFTTVALCKACHTGPMGIHGDKTLWRIYKLDELKALNITLGRIYG
jgi:hypothetical protein